MKKLLPLIIAIVALAGCYNDKADELYPSPSTGGGGTGCDTANVTFALSVKPILDAKCATAGCHDAATQGGGYNFSSYAGAKAAAPRMIGAINWETGYSAMPKGMNKLDACEIAKITKWVNGGALDN